VFSKRFQPSQEHFFGDNPKRIEVHPKPAKIRRHPTIADQYENKNGSTNSFW
tara:strand:- start:6751 stop:6906 length:156 start_codon:yes stop_codon:yes gene_type:complete